MNQKQAMRRYVKEFLVAMTMYVLILIASVSLLNNLDLTRVWQIIISLAPALPIILVIIAILRLLRDSDELQQRVHLLSTTFSAVLTGFITFSYGFLENIGFPHFPTLWILPMLFMLWGLGLAYFTRRYQ